MRQLFSSLVFIFLCNILFAQGITVSGVIHDGESGEGLPYAGVVIKGTGKGTTTNVDGYFTLFNVPSDTATLLISHLGYGVISYQLNHPEGGKGLTIEVEPKAVELKTFEVAASKDQTIEVEQEVSKMTVNPAHISDLPGMGEEDIFHTIQLMPGVSSSNENAGLYVRGGTPDQNLILLDGITVYHVDHFFGIFSAFNANAIKDMQMYKGGFEAKYGNRISSVVDITGKSGNFKTFSLKGNVNMLSANVVAEVPVVKDKVSILAGFRRSYTDFLKSPTYQNIFSSIEEEQQSQLGFGIANNSTLDPVFHFYDGNLRLTARIGNKDVLTVSGYTGLDNLDNSSSENLSFLGGNSGIETTDITNWGNKGLSAKWSRRWNGNHYTSLTGAYSTYHSDYQLINTFHFDTLSFSSGTQQNNDVQDLTIRLDHEFRVNDKHSIEGGLWYTYNDIKYLSIMDDTLLLQDRHDFGNTAALYLEDHWHALPRLTLTPGIRLSYYDNLNGFYPAPRLSALYLVNEHWRVKGAWGLYYQFIDRVIQENIFGGSRDFWILVDTTNVPLVSAWHYILGGGWENKNWLIDAEAWLKSMDGLLEYSMRYGSVEQNLADPTRLYQSGIGTARGIDLLVQRKFGSFTGWMAYTLSEVIYTFSEIDQGDPFPALQDQRHELKLTGMQKLGHFVLSATFVYATGKPYTAPIGQYTITLLDGIERDYIHVGDKNAERLPDYNRLDIAFNYSFTVKGTEIKTGVSLFNVYNRQNIKYKRYQLLEFDPKTYMPQKPELVTTDIKMLGMIPNFFLNIKI